jgi:hypothetical protein
MVSPVKLAFIQARYWLDPEGRVGGIFEAAGVMVGENAGGVVVKAGRGVKVAVLSWAMFWAAMVCAIAVEIVGSAVASPPQAEIRSDRLTINVISMYFLDRSILVPFIGRNHYTVKD